MRKFFANRPSPAMAVAFVALLAALSGTAVALPGTSSVDSGDVKNNTIRSKDVRNNNLRGKDVRNGSLGGADVKNDSLTGLDINESTLGQVPSAATAGSAGSAGTAGTATRANSAGSVDALKTAGAKKVGSSASNPDFDTARAAASEVTLFSAGVLTVYGKCFTDTDANNDTVQDDPFTNAEAYIKTSQNGAIFDSDNNLADGDPFLNTDTIEDDRELEEASASLNGADIDGDEDSTFGAFGPDGTALQGHVMLAAKNGALAGGNGLYGDGNVCIFWGNMTLG
jgi:hypothetical protein